MELPPKDVRFTHTLLNYKNKEIRLIKIEPSADPSRPIQITMRNVDFSGHNEALTHYRERVARLAVVGVSREQDRSIYERSMRGTSSFIALSYTWGPELPAQDILVKSPECHGWLSVRQNLYGFLKIKRDWLSVRQTVDEFSEIEQDFGPSSFWIDQICINQGMDDEKAHQVNQMAEIYSAAYVVEAWLGPGFEGSDELVDLIVHEASLSLQYAETRLSVSERESRELVPSLSQFLSLPYWSRLWVTQEIVLGRLVYIRIGSKTLLWETFYRGLLRLKRVWECLRDKEGDDDLDNGGGKGWVRIHQINTSRGSGDKSWDSVRRLLWGTECSELRDRVFGVMGMLNPSFRIFPDYSMHPEEILLELLTKEVKLLRAKYKYNGESRRSRMIRRECVSTAINWLPQLEDDGNRIKLKHVRRHIFQVLPFSSPKHKNLPGLMWHLMQFIPPNSPILWKMLKPIYMLEYYLILMPWLSVYKAGQACQYKYYIWKKMPNERSRLWRIIRADYERPENVLNPFGHEVEYPLYLSECPITDSDCIE